MTESISQRWPQWLAGIARAMRERGAHPARTVVLWPYAQLMPEAARRWAQARPQGFAPRFETTQNWCQALGGWTPQGADYTGDVGWDSLTARALLEQSGGGDARPAEVSRLVEAVRELAPRVAAIAPGQRAAWAQSQRAALLQRLDTAILQQEAKWAQVALAWLGHSAFVTDRLFDPALIASVDCLVLVPGFLPDPLHAGLLAAWGDRAVRLEAPAGPGEVLAAEARAGADASSLQGKVNWHEASDPQDETLRATACVLRHLEAGRVPVAVPVIDRALTRQIRALLDGRGVQIRDETGWKLSTTRAAAQIMVALRACAWDASTDGVLDWLKHCPAADGPAQRALETWAREQGARRWTTVVARREGMAEDAVRALVDGLQVWRQPMAGRRALPHWWVALRGLLQATGQWTALQADPAGAQVLEVLRLHEGGPPAGPVDAPWAGQRLTLDEFSAWVDRVLESASFKPPYPRHEQVIFLPMAQMLARDFAAVVLAGCDEVRLPASADPPGLWTREQRTLLGLADRESLAQAQRRSFLEALSRPVVDVLWRRADASGEPLLPAPWVRWARWQRAEPALAADPLVTRQVTAQSGGRPAPLGDRLPLSRVSASAYQDLRTCPYRFFALRLLGLRERGEIDVDLAKSDVGLWLHEVLRQFHESDPGWESPTGPQAPPAAGAASSSRRVQALDQAAADASARLGLEAADMLPYMAVWPALRDGYFAWLAGHEADGWRFASGEVEAQRVLDAPAGVTLQGRLDRIDLGPAQARMVIDYKTESLAKTRQRLKAPLEDTQLAFYAALVPEPGVRAAYVNVADREGTQTCEQSGLEDLRDAVLAGLASDLTRVAQGAPLPALGEGTACDYCAARGLCRRDFWSTAA